ncbi:MAG: hypothetical protein ACYC2Y_02240 [Armatimonadota bacterium]
MKCQKCGTPRDIDGKFCKHCGDKLPEFDRDVWVGELIYAAHKHLEAEDFDNALLACQGALALAPESVPVRQLLSKIHEVRWDFAGAVREYKEAQRLDPTIGADKLEELTARMESSSGWKERLRPYMPHLAAAASFLLILIIGLALVPRKKPEASVPPVVTQPVQPLAQPQYQQPYQPYVGEPAPSPDEPVQTPPAPARQPTPPRPVPIPGGQIKPLRIETPKPLPAPVQPSSVASAPRPSPIVPIAGPSPIVPVDSASITYHETDPLEDAKGLQKAGRYREAANKYREAISKGQGSGQVYQQMALSYQRLGENSMAIDSYRRAIDTYRSAGNEAGIRACEAGIRACGGG